MMASLSHFFYELGTGSFHIFWIPLVSWSVLAAIVMSGLYLFESRIAPVVHYYSRVTLLWGLLLGVAGSLLFYFFPLPSSSGEVLPAKFIVISSSIMKPATSGTALHWMNPWIWAGALTLMTLVAAAVGSIKLIAQWKSLTHFTKQLSVDCAIQDLSLSDENRRTLNQFKAVHLYFSADVEVPFTFGWFHKQIILPEQFRRKELTLNMALRHELMHIANGDYLLNSGVEIIKALFYVHPLVHQLTARIREYRELYCDQHVLQNRQISQKNYAQLLFDLSHKSVFKPATAVNMAVQPSTLKKRIQAMKTSTPTLPSFKWSLTIMIAATLFITGMVACSDINDDGITRSEVQKKQSQIYKLPAKDAPLFLLNGKQVDKSKMSHIKPSYIKAVDVLKGNQAEKKYGQAAKNGVVDITLKDAISREKALSDLRDSVSSTKTTLNGDPIYITTHKSPSIIGGQNALGKNLSYPEKCKKAGVEGKVIIQFVVTKRGNIEQPTVVRGIGHGCDKAALKALKQVQWKPAQQNGKAVNAEIAWPITFKLSSKSS